MYTDLEKIEINFPDASFTRKLFRGYTAVVPNIYEITDQREFDGCVNQINECLEERDLNRRKASFVSPFTAQGPTKQRCAASLMDKIRSLDVRRLQVSSEGVVAKPQEGVSYFPVYNNDFFHRHGDPDFFDFSPVRCMSDEGLSINPCLVQMLSAVFGDAASLTIELENEVIGFQPNYGKNHCHLINAQTLRDRLEL